MRVRLIDCFVGKNIDLFHLGRTLAGLYEQRKHKIKLRRADWIRTSTTVALCADDLRIAVEVSDHSDRWDEPLLQWCHVYAKRNMSLRHSSPLQKKIIPLGLNWACHSRKSALAALAAMATTFPGISMARLRHLYRYLATPHFAFFEHRPEQAVNDSILFQTRVWEPHEAPGDTGINDQRIGLLRALKREFGSRVVGGVVATPFALKSYPDLISTQRSRQPQFIRWAKKPLVGIYFRGLFGSIGFKMAEYLAASKCIISEPIDNVLPSPLEHISLYHSIDQCLEACDDALTNKPLADFGRRQSWDYYATHVSPKAHMADLLARARVHHRVVS